MFKITIYGSIFEATLEELPTGSKRKYRLSVTRSWVDGEAQTEVLRLKKFDSVNSAKIEAIAAIHEYISSHFDPA